MNGSGARGARGAYCYVLAGSGRDRFAHLLRLSAWTLRRVQPAARIVLCCDQEARAGVESGYRDLAALVDEVVEVDAEALVAGAAGQLPSALARSRAMKIALRERLRGDLLYLDADTLVARPLDGAFALGADLAAALDRNHAPARYQIGSGLIGLHARAGWPVPPAYFNAGVLLLRDTGPARAFARAWGERWSEWRAATGDDHDQPAFQRALAGGIPGLRFRALPTRYNAMVSATPRSAFRAALFHFFTVTWGGRAASLQEALADRLEQDGHLDEAALERFLRTRYPWADPTSARAQLWCGRPDKALAIWLRRRLPRCLRRWPGRRGAATMAASEGPR